MRKAFYAGSFDPLTNGHLDVLRACERLADALVVGIGVHPGKTPMFDFATRARLIGDAVAEAAIGIPVEVAPFDGLVVDAARAAGCALMVRGLRDGTDLDYEMQMAGMNGTMAPDIATVFVPASPGTRMITATLVRQISRMGGDVAPFVPPVVLDALRSGRQS